jgi:hypothetical protein
MPALNAAPIGDLRGLWRRSLLRYADGSSDTTTRVHWLQGDDAFVDLRQPADLGDFPQAHCRDALSLQDCARLSRQQGFAGRLTFDGSHYEWIRRIDYQPKSPTADAGSLEWHGDLLIEDGRDIVYREHWHREGAAPGTATPCAALQLRAAGGATCAALLRVGPQFMYARDRADAAPGGRSLAECVAGAASLAAARQLVDCEISFGRVSPGGWRISASTLPYRVGDIVTLDLEEHRAATSDRSHDGAAITRVWEIVGTEGALGAWRGA